MHQSQHRPKGVAQRTKANPDVDQDAQEREEDRHVGVGLQSCGNRTGERCDFGQAGRLPQGLTNQVPFHVCHIPLPKLRINFVVVAEFITHQNGHRTPPLRATFDANDTNLTAARFTEIRLRSHACHAAFNVIGGQRW